MAQPDQPEGPVTEQKKNSSLIIFIGILIACAAAFYFYFQYSTEPSEPVRISTPLPEKKLGSKEKSSVTVPSSFEAEDVNDEIEEEVAKATFVLPELDNSDEFVRERAPVVSEHTAFSSWLKPNRLIRKLTLLIDNISRGELSRKYFKRYVPKGKLRVRKISDGVYIIDPRSYRRYNKFTEIVSSLDSRATILFYRKFKPLFQEAYEELGYPDQDFDQVLLTAADKILTAPVIRGPVELYRPSVMYKFTDRKLEKLSPAQKQMIRMGPKNTEAIQSKTRELAELLREEVPVSNNESKN